MVQVGALWIRVDHALGQSNGRERRSRNRELQHRKRGLIFELTVHADDAHAGASNQDRRSRLTANFLEDFGETRGMVITGEQENRIGGDAG